MDTTSTGLRMEDLVASMKDRELRLSNFSWTEAHNMIGIIASVNRLRDVTTNKELCSNEQIFCH